MPKDPRLHRSYDLDETYYLSEAVPNRYRST
jgi:hypothetical protein